MSPEFRALQEAVAGRFSVIRELGRGGMGVVFLARDVALERLVAIKLLPPMLATEPTARARFLREARTVAGLTHPHIVPIHLVEERDGLVFFVMGFVDGETLGDRVRRAGPLAPSEAMQVIQEVAWALAHAHRGGVVHRDVKPDNILLDRETGRAMVTDFGIARALATDTPGDGSVAGTPQYVSPEVARGGDGDARSDLYSLGVTAWVAAAGRLPFEGASAAALLLAHVHSQPPSLATAVPRIPPRFALAVDRCLLKASAERWASVDAFAAEVDAARSRIARVPAPVRAFLREWDGVGGEVATAATASLVALTESVGLHLYDVIVYSGSSLDTGILKWVFALIAVLTAGLAKARILQLVAPARAMLRDGYGHDRLAAAQTIELAQRAEERTGAAARAPRREAWMMLASTAAGTVGAFALAFSDLSGWLNVLGCTGAVLLPTLTLRGLWRFGTRSGETPWDRLLRGPLGRAVFRIAGARLDAPAATSALEGPEPTAIALGQAARGLYAGLPAAARLALPEVPALITALERDAMALRASADDPVRSERFIATVTALETLRLDLLRLQAHAVPSTELTEQIERVREFGAEVDRRLAAEREVRGLLEQREPTPA